MSNKKPRFTKNITWCLDHDENDIWLCIDDPTTNAGLSLLISEAKEIFTKSEEILLAIKTLNDKKMDEKQGEF